MSFYFNAKYGLFTYAQCGDLDPFDVVCLFSELGAECIIGREEHQDGGTHLHAFAAWEKSSDHAVLISLMLEDSTQMLSHLVVHRRVVTTMLQRMVTLSEGDLSDQMEAKFLALAMHGLRSSTRRVEMSFGDLFRNWLLEVLPAISTLSETTPNGSTEKTQHHTSTQPISALTRETFLSSMNGYNTTWRDIHVEVSDACGWPSTVSAWPAGTAPTGHPIGDPTLMGQCPSINIH